MKKEFIKFKIELELIKLDYDTNNFNSIFNTYFTKRTTFIFNTFKLKFCFVNVFKTKKGYHIVIGVNNKLSNQDTVFIQLALGSDYIRECWYWKQIKYTKLKNKIWNVLFAYKEYNVLHTKPKEKPSREIYDKSKSKRIAIQLIKIYNNPKWQ